jgi:hypothetical protein
MAEDDRLERIEKSVEALTKQVSRMGRYAMVIARIHEDEIGSLKKRVFALEDGEDGDTITR